MSKTQDMHIFENPTMWYGMTRNYWKMAEDTQISKKRWAQDFDIDIDLHSIDVAARGVHYTKHVRVYVSAQKGY